MTRLRNLSLLSYFLKRSLELCGSKGGRNHLRSNYSATSATPSGALTGASCLPVKSCCTEDRRAPTPTDHHGTQNARFVKTRWKGWKVKVLTSPAVKENGVGHTSITDQGRFIVTFNKCVCMPTQVRGFPSWRITISSYFFFFLSSSSYIHMKSVLNSFPHSRNLPNLIHSLLHYSHRSLHLGTGRIVISVG